MDINATLLVQMIIFALFVWFTMKFVWPPITNALEARQNRIADGLAAAERGKRELELAKHRVTENLREAKIQANEIIDKAHQRANKIIDDAKLQAKEEASRIAKLASEQLLQEVHQVKDNLRRQVATLAVSGAERLIEKNIDLAANSELIDKLIEEL